VVVDTSPLSDGRRHAGIGRYVASMITALTDRQDLRLRPVSPLTPTFHDSWVARWVNAQPALALARLGNGAALLHGMASEASVAWPPDRQVVTLHDIVPWTHIGGHPITQRHLAAQMGRLRRCAAIIAVSDIVAAEAIDRLDLEPGRVHVVPEGVSPMFTSIPREGDAGSRRRAGITEGDYVLWVGSLRRHDPRKALDILLAAAAQAGAATLVLAGAEGEESRRLAALAAPLGIRLVLPGYVPDEDLAALYRGAAVSVLPSIHEGFGLPVLEAMASGVPVVATHGGNLADLAGDVAVLVPPNDVKAIAGAINRLLQDPLERARLAAAGPLIAARYTWQRTAEMTVAVYKGLISPT
jgi:glycosyltransferase involved in cell wall biosynthesis